MTAVVLPWAALVWGAKIWFWPALALLLVAAITLWWGYARLTGPRWVRVTAFSLKAGGVVLLALALLDPLWSSRRARPGENLVLLLVDTSQSMQVKGSDGHSSAAQAFAARLTREDQPWLVRLKQDFDLRSYSFDSRLEPRTSFSDLTFEGRASSLNAALKSLSTRFAGRSIAGVILLTDGIATDAPLSAALTNLPPIYPVLPPSLTPAAEVSLARVTTTQTNFEDAPITITADATQQGFANEPLVCQLFDESGKLLETQEKLVTTAAGDTTFRFQFRPERAGLSFYKVQLAAKSELNLEAAKSHEATLANNVRLVQVDRGGGSFRILYVGGAPNPEHKFLARALAEDDQIELISLMRIARREPKFDFRTRAGESTNPLFRGFDKTNEETERYDQPVFVRLGIKEERELRDGFPKTADQLFTYHAVILDDVEAELFSSEQHTLLSRFVSERGGGLLMLGGPDSFEKGLFAKTAVADVLPVYLQRSTEIHPANDRTYRWELTREGWLEPWLRLRASEAEEQTRLQAMPPFRTVNRVAGIKPGASLLAVAVDASGNAQPALAVQQYGHGHAAALMVGDLWRWRLKSDPENQDLEKMWRQLIRWLAADVPGRIAVTHEWENAELTNTLRLAVRARDANYQPLDNARVTFTLTPPDGKVLTLEAEPSRQEAGVYETHYVPRMPGIYRALAKVVDGAGAELGQQVTGWANDPAAEEFRSLIPDRAALSDLAKRSGGETVELANLDSFAAGLAARPMKEVVHTLHPLWHTSWFFTFALACLAGEWGLRRWKGLP
jgi:uncharacterized membrane protein